MSADAEADLEAILLGDRRMREILEVVREVGPPGALVGAGAVRTVVWDALGETAAETALRDVDVAYFDPDDLTRVGEPRYEEALRRRLPDVVWDVKNQAAVHLWYEESFGIEVEALASLEEAVATWPETCTCVAVRLDAGGRLIVVAPFGLDDLMGLVWRRNPTRVTVEEYRRRLASRRPAQRWPGVTVIDP